MMQTTQLLRAPSSPRRRRMRTVIDWVQVVASFRSYMEVRDSAHMLSCPTRHTIRSCHFCSTTYTDPARHLTRQVPWPSSYNSIIGAHRNDPA